MICLILIQIQNRGGTLAKRIEYNILTDLQNQASFWQFTILLEALLMFLKRYIFQNKMWCEYVFSLRKSEIGDQLFVFILVCTRV